MEHTTTQIKTKMRGLIIKENAEGMMQERKGETKEEVKGSEVNTGCWLGGWEKATEENKRVRMKNYADEHGSASENQVG